MAGEKSVVAVDGRELTLTNLDKVLYPSTGTTKGDVLAYYAQIAPYLIAHAKWRPATRKRWVDGVGTEKDPGPVFFQKNLEASTPSWVRRFSIAHSERENDYPLVNDTATLIWLAQMAALEIHVPQWQFGPRGRRKNPDRIVLDLDPGDGAGLPECVEVAKAARRLLTESGMEAVPVTSGSKGIHLYSGLDGTKTSEQISSFAHDLARELESQLPDLVVSDMRKALRQGKVLVDWSQNNGSKTTVAPYSLRGRTTPTVATPRTWRELSTPHLRQLTYDEVLSVVKRRGDPLASLTSGDGEEGEEGPGDRLATYRAKRHPARTPEPVPQAAPAASTGNAFVIQEHHARRLHFDFRLEHDGVLVSWALPKGVPTDPRENHLAVRTEDHPLEYGGFEGTIPAGEYGAGEVRIWDHGTFTAEKWVDDKEVLATLRGVPDGGLGGVRKFALIHTGTSDDQQWLIHLMPLAVGIPVEPMLAKPGRPQDVTGDEWSLEMKWDGVRAICQVEGGAVHLWSRTGKDLTSTFPDLADDLREACPVDDAVLDGEIVAFDSTGRPDFGRLQLRLGRTPSGLMTSAPDRVPVHLMAFDVLRLKGRSTTALPYRERRELLESLLAPSTAVHVPPAFTGQVERALQASAENGLEGVVAKRRDAPYRPGRRAPDWVKIKHVRTQEVVVAGWRPGNGRRAETVGSLLLGVPDDDGRLTYVGRVGTGFSDRELEDMRASFRSLARKTPALSAVPAAVARDARWLSPTLVGEVQYTEWTADGHLRHPAWRGWRVDKNPSDVTREG